ncbi:hypothetical protein BV25DRAFT_1835423 [Artomyces pyxidatus]|uniref:Uncharacterized protein n=1 Tax=Artomyces pyxidatus TaxID=48021 RepID=A0ACB8TF95_9AGAM|nr:hypothetical protein BV25DRAFT_1835423 [Artomyces pyxidatus]
MYHLDKIPFLSIVHQIETTIRAASRNTCDEVNYIGEAALIETTNLIEGVLFDESERRFLLETKSEMPSNDAITGNDNCSSARGNLTIDSGTCWVLHLWQDDHCSMRANTSEGGFPSELPHFTLQWSGGDDRCPKRRATSYGKPNCGGVLRFVQLSLTDVDRISDLIIISCELVTYMPILRPFLSTIPPPFTWMVETLSLRRFLFEEDSPTGRFACLMELAVDANAKGNDWYRGNDRTRGLVGYNVAISSISSALKMDLTDSQRRTVGDVFAIVLANRASVLLAGGSLTDAKQAAIDGEVSERLAPWYYKPEGKVDGLVRVQSPPLWRRQWTGITNPRRRGGSPGPYWISDGISDVSTLWMEFYARGVGEAFCLDPERSGENLARGECPGFTDDVEMARKWP